MKQDKKKLPHKLLLMGALVVAVVLCFGIGMAIGMDLWQQPDETVPTQPTQAPVIAQAQLDRNPSFDLGQGLILRRTGSYSGKFWEDGSDETVSQVQAILVENTAGRMLQYAVIKLQYQDHTAVFEVSCLPAGAKVLVQEKNRAAYDPKSAESATASQVVFLASEPNWQKDFAMQGLSGALNLKNMTGTDIPGDIYIYYKNAAGDMYYGGIAYRIRLEGGMKAEQIRQILAAHFDPAGSKVVMIQYAAADDL